MDAETRAARGVASASAGDGPISTPLLTAAKAAEYLSVSVDTLSRWRQQGGGPAYVKFTRAKQAAVRYRREDLDRFIGLCMQTSSSDIGTAR